MTNAGCIAGAICGCLAAATSDAQLRCTAVDALHPLQSTTLAA
jgi:hypothetical protein